MTEKKYLLCPGYILSKTDNDRHYISAEKLAQLYNVPMTQCIIQPERPEEARMIDTSKLIILRPQYHGCYDIHDKHHISEPLNNNEPI